ncbi:MAG: protein kinase domain-containing protein [Myxococcota bacterium]
MVERLGDYELIRKVAAGGMAEIHLARTESVSGVSRDVIVKRMLPELAFRTDFVQMFLDEARLAATFAHPNLVQVFHLGQEGESYYIAMELVDGPHLGALFAHSLRLEVPLDIELCAHIVARAADGLHYAHEQRDPATGLPLHIVHRDISPQNVLVSRHGDVKVSDFGVAKAENQSTKTRTGIVKGKVSYLSPEQCLGDPVDRRTDIFALGIVFYELLVRRRLFRDRSDLVTMQRITTEDLAPPSAKNPDVDQALDEIALRALAKHPDDRFPTAAAFSEAIDSWLARRGIADAPQRLQRWMASYGQALGPGSSSPLGTGSSSQGTRDVDEGDAEPTVSTLAQLPSLPTSAGDSHDEVAPTQVVSPTAVIHAVEPPNIAPQEARPPVARPWTGAAKVAVAGLFALVSGIGVWLLLGDKSPARETEQSAPEIADVDVRRETPKSADAGALRVTTTPSGIPVYIDAQAVGLSPVTVARAVGMAEEVEIRVEFPDQPPVTHAARFVPSQELPVVIAARARVEILSEPKGAQVWLDDVKLGTTPLVPLFLAPGAPQRLRLSKKGYADYESTLVPEVGGLLRVSVVLQREMVDAKGAADRPVPSTESGFGELVVNSKPWGMVYIDGKKAGPTPLRLSRVKAGIRSVRVVNDEPNFGFSKTMTVDVKRSKQSSIGFIFQKRGDRYQFERVVR